MVIIMTLWIGNGAVLKTYSQRQLKEFWKLNSSVHELSKGLLLRVIKNWDFMVKN